MKTGQSSAPLVTPKLKRVAIWLQIDPGQELIGEGIGMPLARLLTGMRDRQSAHPIICAPAWAKPKVEEWLRMYGIRDVSSTVYFGPVLSAARPKFPGPGKGSGKFDAEVSWYISRRLSEINPIFLLPFIAMAGVVFAFVLVG